MKRKLFLLSVFVASLLIMVWPAQAAEAVQVTLTADKRELTVGDPVQLSLEVHHPAEYQVIIPKLEQTWGAFEVQEQSQTETKLNDDGSAVTRQTLTVTLFDLGVFETPAFPLTISDGNGQVSETIVSPISLTVIPTLPEGETSLKDIRPQVDLAIPFPWLAVVMGFLAVAAFSGGGWWLYRRRRVAKPFVDNRPPYQRALDELARIEALNLAETGRFKEHYTLVTDCLRDYLEQQFQVHAFDRTTTELKQSLSQSTLSREYGSQLVDLLKISDYVKFAKMIPGVENAYQLTDQARRWVEATRPKAELSLEQPSYHPGHPNDFGPKAMEVAQ